MPAEIACGKGTGDDGQLADLQALHEVDLPPQVLPATKDVLPALDDDGAVVGRDGPFPRAVEQRDAERFLEAGNAARQGGLREVEMLRSTREVAVTGKGQHVPDEVDIDIHARMLCRP